MPPHNIPTRPLPGLAPRDPSPVASTGLSPVLMTGLFVSLLRQHFAEAGHAFNPLLRSLCWAPDAANPAKSAADSPIVIESAAGWDPALVEGRPSLVVAAGDWSWARLGINNEVMGWFGPDGSVKFTDKASGTHRVLAIGPTEAGDAAGHLAWEAVQLLRAALPYVRERYSPALMQIGVVGQGAVTTTIEESRAHPAAPVTIAYQVQQTWSVLADEPRIGRLAMQVTVTPT